MATKLPHNSFNMGKNTIISGPNDISDLDTLQTDNSVTNELLNVFGYTEECGDDDINRPETEYQKLLSDNHESAKDEQTSIRQMLLKKNSQMTVDKKIEYYSGLKIETDSEGNPTSNIGNYKQFIRLYYPHNIMWNEFTEGIEVDKRQIKDYDICEIVTVLSNYCGSKFENNSKTLNAIMGIARDHKYNPVVDYLESLKWDGQPRASQILIDYLGADDTDITRTFTQLWLYAAVKRVFQPGCKFDNILIIQGPQGGGKSELCKRLAKNSEWYVENIEINNKDALICIKSSWIIIMDELSTLTKKEANDVKTFLSMNKDTFRAPYGKVNQTYPRHCVFVGSTNDSTFLRDTSSVEERRYWIVKCNRGHRDNIVFTHFTDNIVDQVWAEVMFWYKKTPDKSLNLPKDLYDRYMLSQREFREDNNNEIFDLLDDALDKEYPYHQNKLGAYELVDDADLLAFYTGKKDTRNTHRIDRFTRNAITNLVKGKGYSRKEMYNLCQKYAQWKNDKWEYVKSNGKYYLQRCLQNKGDLFEL